MNCSCQLEFFLAHRIELIGWVIDMWDYIWSEKVQKKFYPVCLAIIVKVYFIYRLSTSEGAVIVIVLLIAAAEITVLFLTVCLKLLVTWSDGL